MGLGCSMQPADRLIQSVFREVRNPLQGLQPADNLVECLERVVTRDFIDDAMQFAGVRQWVAHFRTTNPGQAAQFFKHAIFPISFAFRQIGF